jgi:hypothetical protein
MTKRMWRMLMMEECRPRQFGNSDSVRPGGFCDRRGGAVAPDSAEGSIVPVDRDGTAAARAEVMQRCLNMSRIMERSGAPGRSHGLSAG